MSKTIRFVSVLTFGAMAVASQAVGIFLNSTVTSGFTGSPQTLIQTVRQNGSDIPFSGIAVNSTATAVLTNGANSMITYIGTGTGSTGTVTFGFSSTPISGGSGTQGFASAATVTAATGDFLTYLNMGGLLIVGNGNTAAGAGDESITLSGNLTPTPPPNNTPEPASFAALGVGAVALIRRRRKA